MIEIRFWHKWQARERYDALIAVGRSCNMAADGRGVIVRGKL